jgi:hypothetical protein
MDRGTQPGGPRWLTVDCSRCRMASSAVINWIRLRVVPEKGRPLQVPGIVVSPVAWAGHCPSGDDPETDWDETDCSGKAAAGGFGYGGS